MFPSLRGAQNIPEIAPSYYYSSTAYNSYIIKKKKKVLLLLLHGARIHKTLAATNLCRSWLQEHHPPDDSSLR